MCARNLPFTSSKKIIILAIFSGTQKKHLKIIWNQVHGKIMNVISDEFNMEAAAAWLPKVMAGLTIYKKLP